MLEGETEANFLDPFNQEIEFFIRKVLEFFQESEKGSSMIKDDARLIGPVLGLGISRQHLEMPKRSHKQREDLGEQIKFG
jgi:hypothetical protein